MPQQLLRRARQQRGWSQSYVAEALGVSTRTVHRWEQGYARPYPYYREQLSTLFEQSIQQLGLLSSELPTALPDTGPLSPIAANLSASSASSLLSDPLIPHTLGHSSRLLGRQELLIQLKNHLFSGTQFALSGLPGIGKTALAVAIALDPEVKQHFSDGILWAGLGPQPNLLSQLSRWGRLLGIRPEEVEDAQRESAWVQDLRAAVGMRRFLFIIDDVWDVNTAFTLQIGGPNCTYLLTTRLPQIAFAFAQRRILAVPELSSAEGRRLLARYVPQLVEQEPEQMDQLVQAVGNLPLALHLLGSHLATHAQTGQPRRILRALEQARDAQQRLRIAQATSPGERPQALSETIPLSLYAVIAISEQRLSDPARTTLRALSLYPPKPNSFSEEAALWANGTVAEMLDELWDAGLLESAEPGRYTLHQTIADYARAQITPPEEETIWQRLRQHWLPWIAEQALHYARMDEEWNNVQVVLEEAYQKQKNLQQLLQAMLALQPYLRTRGLYQLAEHYGHIGLTTAESQQDKVLQMFFLRELAEVATVIPDYAQGEIWTTKGLELVKQGGPDSVRCDLLIIAGRIKRQEGLHKQAQSFLEEALATAQSLQDDKRLCKALLGLGSIMRIQGHDEQAETFALQGLEIANKLQLHEEQCWLLNLLGDSCNEQGNFIQAEEYSQQGLILASELGHRQLQSYHLETLGTTKLGRGHLEDAERYYQEALVIMRQIPTHAITDTLANLGNIANQRGNYEQAAQYLQEALVLSQKLNDKNVTCLIYLNLGTTTGMLGDYQQAQTLFQQALQLAQELHVPWLIAGAHYEWGEIELKYAHSELAHSHFEELLNLSEGTYIDALAQWGLARAVQQQGNTQQARQLAQQSLETLDAMQNALVPTIRDWLAQL